MIEKINECRTGYVLRNTAGGEVEVIFTHRIKTEYDQIEKEDLEQFAEILIANANSKIRVVQSPAFSHYDAICVTDNGVAHIELKRRSMKYADGWMLEFDKYNDLLKLQNITGIPSKYVTLYRTTAYSIDVTKVNELLENTLQWETVPCNRNTTEAPGEKKQKKVLFIPVEYWKTMLKYK